MNGARETHLLDDDEVDLNALTHREVRQAAGVPLIRAAVAARVAEGTARVFEIAPDEIRDHSKRMRLHTFYQFLRDGLKEKRAQQRQRVRGAR